MEELLFDFWGQIVQKNSSHRVLSCSHSGRIQLPCWEGTKHPVERSMRGAVSLLPTVITNLPAALPWQCIHQPQSRLQAQQPWLTSWLLLLETPSQNHPAKPPLNSWHEEVIQKINGCCHIKILSFGAISFTAIDNEYIDVNEIYNATVSIWITCKST